MKKIAHFTWAANVSLTQYTKSKFAPYAGIHPARELLYNLPSFDPRHENFAPDPYLQWMLQRDLWTQHEAMASGAEFATEVWLNHLCSTKPMPSGSATAGERERWCRTVGVSGCMEYKENDLSVEMVSSCGGCILFNDLLLNYTAA
ncbi:hypothetical protein AK812_SmicGene6674 [Symbiodinium microadriaticum]|uniref:Uncharacterized protein n=1 Tax=Symbiodinium microadriaticum TaxID=2951 RepID=A0A1Q9EQR4_SYMMI|nr:hypothetical protein AK812_SmicGene6674 [Symbiodinium microadriaticum]